jgi:hypothetical protein
VERRRQLFVPVSNAETLGRSALGAPSRRYWSRKGQDLAAEGKRRVAAEPQGAERATVVDRLSVVPGTEDEEELVPRRVLRLQRLPDGDRPVDVLLVPEGVDEHRRHREGLGGEDLVDGLFLPERVVRGVREDLPPDADLLEAARPRHLASRAGLEVGVVVVAVVGPPGDLVAARRRLVEEVGDPLLAEGAVVEPVVPPPAVDHRVHRDGDLEGGVRVHERREGEEPVVGDAEDSDAAVRLREVLHEPVDRVVRVGGVVDLRRVQRPAEGAVHDVVALGAVLAPHVLDDADVAPVDDDVRGVVVALDGGAEVGALRVARQRLRVVRSAGEEDRRPLRPLRHEDHGVEADAVAHRDHHVAPLVVPAFRRRDELLRRLAREERLGRGGQLRLRALLFRLCERGIRVEQQGNGERREQGGNGTGRRMRHVDSLGTMLTGV